ncbi:MAG: BrnA antitoxin family protein [Bryobacteraceae bacterium]|jgi:hypothetical protein
MPASWPAFFPATAPGAVGFWSAGASAHGLDGAGPDASDIPPLTDEQLASMTLFRDRPKKTMISLYVREDVLAWLKSKGAGHLTRINDILTNVMEAEKRLGR